MGGATVLEFAYLGSEYVRSIIPIATSARYSAWGISWGEAQRQSIYSDPKYDDGYYSLDQVSLFTLSLSLPSASQKTHTESQSKNQPPTTGLAAARMSALLTYRSRDSFESRFGRKLPDASRLPNINGHQESSLRFPGNQHFAIHNDGHKLVGSPRELRVNNSTSVLPDPELRGIPGPATPPRSLGSSGKQNQTPTYFSAQSYLRYQGSKFIQRFDANCYIAITRKLDTHDVSRNRDFAASSQGSEDGYDQDPLRGALAEIKQPTLILGIESDGLFTFAEQRVLAACIPNATLKEIVSSEGHDAFLLEFEQVNNHLITFMDEVLPDIMGKEPDHEAELTPAVASKSMVSEVDDIAAW
jgi:homoserine O-acetyltransferase